MNGTTESALVELARRSQQSAHRAEQYALEAQQATSRMEREVNDLRREVNDGFTELTKEIRQIKGQRRELHSFTETEWEDSPTGSHMIKRVDRREWERLYKEKQLGADARKWRKALNTSGKVALLVVATLVGWLVRHFAGKP